MAREIQDQTCSRCGGKGELPCFRHVMGGVCFRCWGQGVDPRTISELRAWLERARKEYKARKARLAEVTPPEAAKIRRELAIIERLGKERRARADRLEAEHRAAEKLARARG